MRGQESTECSFPLPLNAHRHSVIRRFICSSPLPKQLSRVKQSGAVSSSGHTMIKKCVQIYYCAHIIMLHIYSIVTIYFYAHHPVAPSLRYSASAVKVHWYGWVDSYSYIKIVYSAVCFSSWKGFYKLGSDAETNVVLIYKKLYPYWVCACVCTILSLNINI